jgi:hypothetical protein
MRTLADIVWRCGTGIRPNRPTHFDARAIRFQGAAYGYERADECSHRDGNAIAYEHASE